MDRCMDGMYYYANIKVGAMPGHGGLPTNTKPSLECALAP
jgi:hypothetical protein